MTWFLAVAENIVMTEGRNRWYFLTLNSMKGFGMSHTAEAECRSKSLYLFILSEIRRIVLENFLAPSHFKGIF